VAPLLSSRPLHLAQVVGSVCIVVSGDNRKPHIRRDVGHLKHQPNCTHITPDVPARYQNMMTMSRCMINVHYASTKNLCTPLCTCYCSCSVFSHIASCTRPRLGTLRNHMHMSSAMASAAMTISRQVLPTSIIGYLVACVHGSICYMLCYAWVLCAIVFSTCLICKCLINCMVLFM
jgi:hypothetical protein